jgi:primosomal protein N' (replication factor Y)
VTLLATKGVPMNYVKVVIDNKSNSTDSLYTYENEFEEVSIGSKVKVPFGIGNKIRDAYVFELSETLDEQIPRLKRLVAVVREITLDQNAVALCRWMKNRYFCRYIDAINCFTPVGALSKRGKVRNPYLNANGETQTVKRLTSEQENAMSIILPFVKTGMNRVFLIHGVTSSGKTELYLRTISETIDQGKTAIMLVPEISVTKQTIERFIGRFGAEKVAVLHSGLTNGERYDEWMRAKNGAVQIVIGARSAVFAPLPNLGTIILDEEHETTYKSDMTPRYDTIEVAIKRASQTQGVVLLGSATPSLVSTYHANCGDYEKIVLKERYNKTPMPTVEILDMRQELKNGNKSIFSIQLYESMLQCLKDKKQVILFLNRRGYSTFVSCRECGFVMKCKDCGVSLTYHKEAKIASCHYCGHKEKMPDQCPICSSKYIRFFGTGTEKVEEATRELFPEVTIERLDLDTAKKKGSIDKILSDFKKGKTDVLIGTQLVAKGLDFANVGLVGIVSADISLNIPDFRSSERTFQLITQASGRAGRGDSIGKVIIQSYTPDHYAIVSAAEHDYQGFYINEISMRKQVFYPPFSQLIQLMLMGEDEDFLCKASEAMVKMIKKAAGEQESINVLGPIPAPINKINDKFRYQILIKSDEKTEEIYREIINKIRQRINQRKKQDILLSVDLNPYSFL